jgi:hypothetical protein
VTGTVRGGGPLVLKIKKKYIKNILRLPDDAPIAYSLTTTGHGGGPIELEIKKIKIKEIGPARVRTD